MKKEIVCIICPRGCKIQVEGSEGQTERIEGNQCARGYGYAESEFVNPCRILTSSVRLKGARRKMLPVRSSRPVPKKQLLACMDEIHKVQLEAPVAIHQVVIPNVLGTGADMVACMPVKAEQEG